MQMQYLEKEVSENNRAVGTSGQCSEPRRDSIWFSDVSGTSITGTKQQSWLFRKWLMAEREV